MQPNEIVELLWKYGHFRNPAYPNTHNVKEADLATLKLTDPVVEAAVRSYQHLQKNTLDALAIPVHGRRAIVDGKVGPATDQLFQMPRCGAPDFALTEEAVGSGRWGQCKLDQFPDNNAVTVSWNLTRCPAHVRPVFEQIWTNVVAAYAGAGMALVRVADNDSKANLTLSFTVPQQEAANLRGNWIGLAVVGWGGIQCSESIWGLFDLNYNPQNTVSEWTTLVKHEIGHNMGLQHSTGGVMNPSIVRGLPISWKGDPSWVYLAKWYGGEPVTPPTPPSPGPGPIPPTPPSGRIPDSELQVVHKGRPVACYYEAQV